ncbi:Secreted protein [Candidatus Magnetomoraceae bacterium gMMP-15]
MNKLKKLIICLIIGLMCFSPLTVMAEEDNLDEKPDAEEMLVDIVLVRPLGLAATIVGSAFFVVSLPFSLIGGNTADVAEKLVAEPAVFTFARPMGNLEY